MDQEWNQFNSAYQILFEELPANDRLQILSAPNCEEAAALALKALQTIQPENRKNYSVFSD
jgi:hypothetical protein